MIGTSDGKFFDNEFAATVDLLDQDQKSPTNFDQAKQDLNLNKQEQDLYQRHLDNLYGDGGVDNPDGTRSTIFASTIQRGDKFYNTPLVNSGKIMSNSEADAYIAQQGVDTFPSYNSPKEAKDRYDQMHQYMEKDTKDYQEQQSQLFIKPANPSKGTVTVTPRRSSKLGNLSDEEVISMVVENIPDGMSPQDFLKKRKK